MIQQVYTIFPFGDKFEKTSPISKKNKEKYIEKLKSLRLKYSDIQIKGNRKIFDEAFFFFQGLFLALATNYILFFLARHLPKNVYLFFIEFDILLIIVFYYIL